MSFILGHFLLLSAIIICFYLTGALVGGGFARSFEEGPAPLLSRGGLGAACWISLLWALASVGLLRSRVILVAFALLLLLGTIGWWQRRGRAGLATLGDTESPVEAPAQPGSWLLGISLAALLAALFVQTLWPQISWDADTYHLTVPRLYLEHGGFRRIPFNVYSNWPLNIELLFALAMVLGDYVLAKLIHFAFGVATLLLIYQTGRAVSSPWAGWAAATLWLANPVVLSEFRVAYVDLALAFFFLLAFVFVHAALEESDRRGDLLIAAGVFSGVAAGIKPTGIVAALCLCGLFVAVALRRREAGRAIVAGTGRILLPACLLLLPWLAKSGVLTGNPVYPFLFSTFGGPEWSLELSEQLRAWQRGIGMGREWTDYLLLPVRVILFGQRGYESFDGRILPLWLLLIPLGVWAGRRHAIVRRGLGVTLVYFLFWSATSQQMRFLIAVLPFLALAGGVALADLLEQVPKRRRASLRLVTSCALAAVLLIPHRGVAPTALSALRDYWHYGSEIEAVAVEPVYDFIDRQLPKDAKLVFLNTNHGFFCRRDFIADSFFEASQLNDLMRGRESKQEIGRLFRDLGATHLLIENRDRYIPWPRSLFDYLNDSERVRLRFRSPEGAYDVVEILR